MPPRLLSFEMPVMVGYPADKSKGHMDVTNPTAAEKPDWIARYFLRRLAMAHRESPNRKPWIQHNNALVETILVFVGMPVIAIASLILIPSLRWAPQIFPKWTSFSQLGFALMLWILSVIIGHMWLGPKFKKYRDDRSAVPHTCSSIPLRIGKSLLGRELLRSLPARLSYRFWRCTSPSAIR